MAGCSTKGPQGCAQRRKSDVASRRKVRCVAVVAVSVVLLWVLSGCGSDSGSSTIDAFQLTENVRGLDQGALLGEVEATLGEPISRVEGASGVELNYGMWQLAFHGERLQRRSRVLAGKAASTFRARSPQELDELVTGLKLGSSLLSVERLLGSPASVYEIVEDEAIRILRYGAWELTFEDGKLSQRSK